jgi:hypothetical protein
MTEHRTGSWREVRLMWLVIGLPLASVVAGLITLAIAISARDELVETAPAGSLTRPATADDAAP